MKTSLICRLLSRLLVFERQVIYSIKKRYRAKPHNQFFISLKDENQQGVFKTARVACIPDSFAILYYVVPKYMYSL